MHRYSTGFVLSAIGVATATPIAAETLTVCASGCDFASINAAIDVASDGDVIQLSAETYLEGSVVDTDGKAIEIRGAVTKDGDPASVLDGTGVHRVLVCRNGETSTTVFRNLLIRNGRGQQEVFSVGQFQVGGGLFTRGASPVLENCTIASSRSLYGAGMFADGGSIRLVGCTFEANVAAGSGGGIYAFDREGGRGGAGVAHTLSDCEFLLNSGDFGGGLYLDGAGMLLEDSTLEGNEARTTGGGAFLSAASVVLDRCRIAANSAGFHGGGVCNSDCDPRFSETAFVANFARNALGGGIYNVRSSPWIDRCSFEKNVAINFVDGNPVGGGGGGIFNDAGSAPTVTSCTFTENQSFGGGGLANDGGAPTMIDCSFSGNTAAGSGGGLLHFRANGAGESPVTNLIRCTFAANNATFGGGGIFTHLPVVLEDCIVSGNVAGSASGGLGCSSSGDPRFDLSGGRVCGNVPNQFDVDCDPLDVTGTCVATSCDECESCPGDLSGDGQVAGEDLGLLFASWGACADCDADLDGNGTVDGGDLGLLFIAWGDCL